MNVAYLLVSTAWLSGQTPDGKDTKAVIPPPAVVHPAAPVMGGMTGGSCGCESGCDTGCCDSGSSWGHRFRERMRGLFRRGGHGNDCCDTCAPAPTCCSAPAPSCCSAPAPSGNTCDSCCDSGSSRGHRFRERMRGLFRRGGHGNDCCDTGCNSCGGGGVGYGPGGMMMPAPKGELIPLPKDGTPLQKMPNDKGTEPPANGTKGVQINVVPNAPMPAATPALESAPTITPAQPAIEENKTPF